MKKSTIFSLLFMCASSAALCIVLVDAASYLPISTNSAVEKKVAAFYYPWYGNTTDYTQSTPYPISDSASWWHWNSNGFTPPANACSTFTPELGWYDSADPVAIEQHLRDAEWAGIDAFICSFWGAGGGEFSRFQVMLNVAKNISSNMTFTIYYETGIADNKPDQEAIDKVASDINTYYTTVMTPQFEDLIWKEEGKPVVWLYVVGWLAPQVWSGAFENLTSEGHEIFAIADRPGDSIDYLSLFDGSHEYDIYQRIRDDNYEDCFLTNRRNARRNGMVYVAGVAPGYDDEVVRCCHEPLDREGGKTYTDCWSRALSTYPDWITITSWNEWHEGTEIEPSIENGDLALNQTKEYINAWKIGDFEGTGLQVQSITDMFLNENKIELLGFLLGWVMYAGLIVLFKKHPRGIKGTQPGFTWGIVMVCLSFALIVAHAFLAIEPDTSGFVKEYMLYLAAPGVVALNVIGSKLIEARGEKNMRNEVPPNRTRNMQK
ncbi:MAG: hypothetical protein ACFFCS_24010 [Candidatus Hodarchaeota archaeon]